MIPKRNETGTRHASDNGRNLPRSGIEVERFLSHLRVFPRFFDIPAAVAVTGRTWAETERTLDMLASDGAVSPLSTADPVRLFEIQPAVASNHAEKKSAPLDLLAAEARHAEYFLLHPGLEQLKERAGPNPSTEYLEYCQLNHGRACRHVRQLLAKQATALSPHTLTERQWEVAELIARGRTNDQIASALGIARWTAINHVRTIMSKLDCASRVDVARFVFSRHQVDCRVS